MALLDFLKNKKSATKSKKVENKPAKVLDTKTEKPATEVKPVNAKIKEGKFSYDAVKQPHISEKASYLAEKDQYVFVVSSNYNKNEVKKAVEGIYGVNVLNVNVLKVPAKKRRLGRTEGYRKGYKKAIVTIKNGQKIEIL